VLPAQCYALTFHDRLDHQDIVVDGKPAVRRHTVDARTSEPLPPVAGGAKRLFEMYQPVLGEMGDRVRHAVLVEIGGARHRLDHLRCDQRTLVIRPVFRSPAAHAQFDVLVADIDIAIGSLDAQIDVGQIVPQPVQPWQHPQRGKCGRCRQRHGVGPAARSHVLCRSANMAQSETDIGMKTSACLGQRNGAVGPVKQLGSELAFERPDRVADRSLGHAQFLCRPGEAELTPGRFKDNEIARRGQQVSKVVHKLTLSNAHEFSSITLSGNDPRLVLRRGEHGHCRYHGAKGFKSAAARAGRRT
jgi:hypothetical protein